MTVMPLFFHWVHRISKSIIFFCPRYNTGRRPRSVPAASTASAGDGFCFPAANHVSLSATQKSGSLCAAIASRDVNMILSVTVNSVPFLDKYSVTGVKSFSGSSVGDGCGWSGGVSKSMSENTGVKEGISDSSDCVLISKSDGNGNSPGCDNSGACCALGFGVVIFVMSKFDFGVGPVCARARANAARISVGYTFCDTDFSGVGVGGGGVVSGSLSVWIFTGCKKLGNFIVNNGFFVR